jgi:hypothetical protein
MQVVEHGSGLTIRRHWFWKLSIHSCFVCVRVVFLQICFEGKNAQ